MDDEQMIIDHATKNVNEDVQKQEEKDSLNKIKMQAKNFINGVRLAIQQAQEIDMEMRSRNRYSVANIYTAMKKSTQFTV